METVESGVILVGDGRGGVEAKSIGLISWGQGTLTFLVFLVFILTLRSI